MNAGNGKAEQWLISFTKQLRSKLPQGKYIITHARTYLIPTAREREPYTALSRQLLLHGSRRRNGVEEATSRSIRRSAA